MFPFRSYVFVLLTFGCLFTAHLSAVERSPVLPSLRMQSLTSCLKTLPEDANEQEIGNQIRYLAWLAMGDSVQSTCQGPWHDQIMALLVRRPAQPKDDLPERWVKLMYGDAVGAVAGLTATTEEARALRAIAEKNPALINVTIDRSPIAFQAAITAASALSRASLFPRIRSVENRIDLCFQAGALLNCGGDFDRTRAVADWIAVSTWVLGKPVVIAPGSSNMITIAAITSALNELRMTKHPTVGTHPAYAWHVMMRGYTLFIVTMRKERALCKTYAQWLSGPMRDLEAAQPTPVMLARAMLGESQDHVDGYKSLRGDVPDAATVQRCGALLRTALADNWSGQTQGWCDALYFLALVAPEVAAPLVKQAAAQWPGGVQAPQTGGLASLARSAWKSYATADVYPLLAAAAQRNPWEFDFAYWERSLNPRLPALYHAANAKPDAEWVQDTIDVAALPFPHVPTPTPMSFSITWTGTVDVPTAGAWWFGVESDDDSYLHVGPLLIQNRGAHGMQVHGGTITLPAGPQPLSLEYVQRFMGAGCRFLWHKEGDQPAVVPASALSHGADRAPGLAAAYTALANEYQTGRLLVPGGDEMLAWVAKNPQNLYASEFYGLMFGYQKCYDEALPLLYHLRKEPTKASDAENTLVASLLLGTTLRLDEALKLTVNQGHIGGNFDELWGCLWVIRKAGRQADVITAMNGHWAQWSPMATIQRAFLEVDTGQFNHYRNIETAARSEMHIHPYHRGILLMAEIAFAPLAGQPLAEKATVDALITRYNMPRDVALACDVVLGNGDLAAAHVEAKALDSDGIVSIGEGMRAMMEGRWDEAYLTLHKLSSTDPEQSTTWIAKGLAQRIAQLSPAERQKIPALPKLKPKMMPIPEVTPLTEPIESNF